MLLWPVVFLKSKLSSNCTKADECWLGLLQNFEVAMPCPGARSAGLVDSCLCQAGTDDVTNFMDGSPDSCLLHFTPCQAMRMHAIYWQYHNPLPLQDLQAMVQATKINRLQGKHCSVLNTPCKNTKRVWDMVEAVCSPQFVL